MVNEELETTKDFYVYRTYTEKGDPEIVLRLPTYPDNCGWFEIDLPDGRKYTVFDMSMLIEEYTEQYGPSGEAMEANEDNEFIELKNELVERMASKIDGKTAKEIVEDLWGNYKIERP